MVVWSMFKDELIFWLHESNARQVTLFICDILKAGAIWKAQMVTMKLSEYCWIRSKQSAAGCYKGGSRGWWARAVSLCNVWMRGLKVVWDSRERWETDKTDKHLWEIEKRRPWMFRLERSWITKLTAANRQVLIWGLFQINRKINIVRTLGKNLIL